MTIAQLATLITAISVLLTSVATVLHGLSIHRTVRQLPPRPEQAAARWQAGTSAAGQRASGQLPTDWQR